MKVESFVKNKYTVYPLTPYNWKPFSHLMYPSLTKQLEQGWNQDQVWMVGIKSSDLPIALAVLEWDKAEKEATLRSVYVLKEHRRKGLASTLLKHIYSFCQNHDITNIRATYYARKGTTTPVEDWLIKNGFTSPQMEAWVYHIDRQIAQAPWLELAEMPKDLRIVPWPEIEDSLQRKLLTDARHSNSSFLFPCKSFAPLEPLNSLALISSSGIEGWSISYRIRQDVILYDDLYVVPEYQQTDLSVLMLSEAIRIHLNQIDLIPFGLFAVNRSVPDMFMLAREWVEPYALKVIEKRFCQLVIKAKR